MDAERGGRDNIMGYDTCGVGLGTEEGPNDEYDDEPEDKKPPMGFSPHIIKC